MNLPATAHNTMRKLKEYLVAHGVGTWTPLVPEVPFTACIRESLEFLCKIHSADTLGDYLEFGVSRGTSMACVYNVLDDMGIRHVRLLGFDSFRGLPPEAAEQGWRPGQYRSTRRATYRYLVKQGVNISRVHLVKGWFSDTLTEDTRRKYRIGKASLILIDSDIYSASREALFFIERHVKDDALIILDDWGWRSDRGLLGQREAFDEFLNAHRELSAEPLPAYRPEARVFHVSRR